MLKFKFMLLVIFFLVFISHLVAMKVGERACQKKSDDHYIEFEVIPIIAENSSKTYQAIPLKEIVLQLIVDNLVENFTDNKDYTGWFDIDKNQLPKELELELCTRLRTIYSYEKLQGTLVKTKPLNGFCLTKTILLNDALVVTPTDDHNNLKPDCCNFKGTVLRLNTEIEDDSGVELGSINLKNDETMLKKIKIASDGKLLIAIDTNFNKMISLCEKNSNGNWKLIKRFPDKQVIDVAFGLHESRLLVIKDISANKSSMKVYDLSNFELLSELDYHRCKELIGAKTSKDGTFFVVPATWFYSYPKHDCFNAIYVLDASSGKVIRNYNPTTMPLFNIEKNKSFSYFDIAFNNCFIMIFSNFGYILKINLKLESTDLPNLLGEIREHAQVQLSSRDKNSNFSCCLF